MDYKHKAKAKGERTNEDYSQGLGISKCYEYITINNESVETPPH